MGITSPNTASSFTRIPTRAIGDSRLTHAELRVLSAICRYTDNTTGKAFPSIDTLREAACVSINTLRTSIRKLESLKYVTVSTRKAENGGQLSNVYCVKF